MNPDLLALLLVLGATVLAYFIGSFQSSYLLGKAVFKKDVRDYGSHNAGATNAIRVFGLKFGLLCLAIDALKGALAVLLARLMFNGPVTTDSSRLVLLELFIGIVTILGHNHPFYMGFKGGKGVASTIGIMFAIDWRVALIAGIPALLILAIFRIMSPASLSFQALIFLVFTVLYFHTQDFYLISLASLVYPAISFYRHKDNIKRLLAGQEAPLWGKGSKKDKAKQAAANEAQQQ